MFNKFPCIFTADLHGQTDQYNKLASFAFRMKIKTIFLGGDLFPKIGGLWYLGHKTRTIESQVDFIHKSFIPFLTKVSQLGRTFFIMGNDDFRSNESLLKNIDRRSYLVHFRSLPINETYSVIGYPYVQLTPFLNKDWERWDETPGTLQDFNVKTRGFYSDRKIYFPIDYNSYPYTQNTIVKDLVKINKLSDPYKTVYLFHAPPYATHLDMTSGNNPYIKNTNLHLGSRAIKSFINKSQPYLTLHGHIHETVDESGNFIEIIGKTVSIACGNGNNPRKLALIIFDLDKPQEAQRIVI